MGRTIIQPIGPLYGEAVNGTVFGRPNGSIYVPPTNLIEIVGATGYITNVNSGGEKRVRFSDALGADSLFDVIAQSQDPSSYVDVVLADDADLSVNVQSRIFNAGSFNLTALSINRDYELTIGNTYYVAALLMNNGEPVASSTVYEVVAV